MTGSFNLSQRLRGGPLLIAPGVADPLTALLAEAAGFQILFLSGACMALQQLGRPDVGLFTATELAGQLTRITDRVSVPVVVDADSGHGNAAQVMRTVRLLEAAGASAIQIEDQLVVKPVDALAARPLITPAEMVGKVRAAVDARRSADTLISARTDALSSGTLGEAIDRLELYAEAGADLLFAEGLSSAAELATVGARFAGRWPVVHNLLPDGRGGGTTAAEAEAHGFALAYQPLAVLGPMAAAAIHALSELRAGVAPAAGHAARLGAAVGTPDFLARAAGYATRAPSASSKLVKPA